MIYLVIKETGEYDSYSMGLMFASTSEAKAQQKLTELERTYQLASKLHNEIMEYVNEYAMNNPYPPYPTEYSKEELVWISGRGWMHPTIIAHEKKEDEQRKKWYAARQQKLKELAAQHNINAHTIDNTSAYDVPRFSIQEVESDNE